MTFRSINPATGQTLAEFPAHTPEQVEASLARAAAAASRWRRTAVAHRAAVVTRLGELLDAEKDRIGRMMTLEMGKPIRAAIEEAAKCALACRYYVEHGPAFIADEPVADHDHRSFVAYDPLGVVLAVMPWNFPFLQVFRFFAPSIM
jgi:succinate-semialdehyde dehydrogenase/glutarate-semialdehyde dehydrogenase